MICTAPEGVRPEKGGGIQGAGRACLGAGEALVDRDAGDHLQHDHGKAVDVAEASDAPVVQHLHGLVRHRACVRQRPLSAKRHTPAPVRNASTHTVGHQSCSPQKKRKLKSRSRRIMQAQGDPENKLEHPNLACSQSLCRWCRSLSPYPARA